MIHGYEDGSVDVFDGCTASGHTAAASVALLRSTARAHTATLSHQTQSGRLTHEPQEVRVEHSAGQVNVTFNDVAIDAGDEDDDGVVVVVPVPLLLLPPLLLLLFTGAATTNSEVGPSGHSEP